MVKKKRILIDELNLNANPYLEGTRLTVFDIVSSCRSQGIERCLESAIDLSPDLSVGDLRSVFEYCQTRQCDSDGSHCGGCSLRHEQDGVHTQEDFINRFAEVHFVDSNTIVKGMGQGEMWMPGTPETLSQTWRGEDGWVMASELIRELEK